MSNWQPAATAPKEGYFLARLWRWGDDSLGGFGMPLVIGPCMWEIEMECFTDTLGEQINKPIEGGFQQLVGWMPWPEMLDG